VTRIEVVRRDESLLVIHQLRPYPPRSQHDADSSSPLLPLSPFPRPVLLCSSRLSLPLDLRRRSGARRRRPLKQRARSLGPPEPSSPSSSSFRNPCIPSFFLSRLARAVYPSPLASAAPTCTLQKSAFEPRALSLRAGARASPSFGSQRGETRALLEQQREKSVKVTLRAQRISWRRVFEAGLSGAYSSRKAMFAAAARRDFDEPSSRG